MLSFNSYRNLIQYLFFILAFHGAFAQGPVLNDNGTGTDYSYVKWVKQYPSSSKEKTKKNFFASIGELVVGKKDIPDLTKPISLIAANPDSLTILDQGTGKIFEVERNNPSVLHFRKNKFDDFSSLVGICSLPDKEILFTDSRQNKIFLITADKKELKVFGDSLVLHQPTGIAYCAVNHEIWVVETGAHRICILNEKGELLKTIGNRGSGQGEFNFPTSISIDKSGFAYIVDAMNYRIQIFNSNGDFVSSFGEVGDGSGYFACPKGIATDSYGNIYVVDAMFHTVQIFDKTGRFLYNFGQQGHNQEDLWMPAGIFIDKNNFIYVADSYNSRIQTYQLVYANEKSSIH